MYCPLFGDSEGRNLCHDEKATLWPDYPEPLLHARIRPAEFMTTRRVPMLPVLVVRSFLKTSRPRTRDSFGGSALSFLVA